MSHEARHHRQVALTPGQRTEMDGGADWGENDLKISQPAILTISGPCKKEAGDNWRCDELVSNVFLFSGTPMAIKEKASSQTAAWKDRYNNWNVFNHTLNAGEGGD